MFDKIFYGPGDWLVRHTNRRQRTAINFWLLIIWLIPGTIIWLLLKDVIWFIGAMSLYAIWVGHLGALSAETPVESEADVDINNDIDINVKP